MINESEDDDASDQASSNSSSSFDKRYKIDELPWDLMVAMHHPTAPGAHVFVGRDLGQFLKKNRNSVENSGKEVHKRELYLHGIHISMCMLFYEYIQSASIPEMKV